MDLGYIRWTYKYLTTKRFYLSLSQDSPHDYTPGFILNCDLAPISGVRLSSARLPEEIRIRKGDASSGQGDHRGEVEGGEGEADGSCAY